MNFGNILEAMFGAASNEKVDYNEAVRSFIKQRSQEVDIATDVIRQRLGNIILDEPEQKAVIPEETRTINPEKINVSDSAFDADENLRSLREDIESIAVPADLMTRVSEEDAKGMVNV